ncbi:MAG TPA: hypothetical protein VF100_00320 [Thermoanaerobaculia bacterium]
MRRAIVSGGILLTIAAAALCAPAPGVAAAEAGRSVALAVRSEQITFEVDDVYHGLRLRLGGPDGSVLELREEAAARLAVGLVDAEGQPLPNGLYAYELRGRLAEREVLLGSGFFSILDGAFVSPDLEEAPDELRRATAAAGPVRIAAADQVVPDDLIVQGKLCVGFDCVDSEAFGSSAIRLKENNPWIELQDTSTATGFPSTDWRIRANDSASGGANVFAIDDLTGGRTPLSLLAGAPDNALFVNALGNVGLGTAVPVRKLHLSNGNTPALRLEQDGSGGFTPQSWEVGGNELNFFVQDVTTFTFPLRIEAGAGSNSLRIDASGAVGLGTGEPTERLDVAGNIAVSGTVDGRDVATDGAALDAHLADHSNPHGVTAAQAGADPAGTAAAQVAAHEGTFDHANLPSALPVPIAEGGTGATDAATARANLGISAGGTKAGIVPASSFAGNPATATVAFADPFPAGTVYAVLLTAVTADGRTLTAPNVLAKGETGFTITVGGKSNLVEVGWLARPVGE